MDRNMENTRTGTEAKGQPQNSRGGAQNDAKRLLTALKMTTTVGAVSLTLAGWGLLARANTLAATQDGQMATARLESVAAAAPTQVAAARVSRDPVAQEGAVRSSTQAVLPTVTPQPTPSPTAPAQAQVKLDVVQWVQTRAGDPVAVVRDNINVLWYVWGPDVDRIEQGLSPEYQPVPVDSVARTRNS